MQWDVLINPVVGGVIGYATNYLAIKMLFRPYNTKYIGKMKIPFTPGLIPKEKATLARQMGEITEEYLLTEDMLADTLTGPKAKDVFLKFSNSIPKYMEESNQTITEAAKAILGADLEASTDAVVDQFTVEIIAMLRSKEVMDLAIPHITNTIIEIVSRESVVPYIKQFGEEVLESDKGKEHIGHTLERLEEQAYRMIQDNAPNIGKGIIGTMGEGDEADAIRETLQHWIDENFNPMVSMFIKVDKIYEGMISFANEALEDPERAQKFGDLLCKVIQGLKESQPDYKDKVIGIIKEQINEENIRILLGLIKQNTKVQIEPWIYKEWDGYVNTEEFFEVVKRVLRELMRFIGDTSLANVSMIIPSTTKNQINEKIFSYYTAIIKSNSKEVAEVMDISQLVENKISEFSSEEAEKLILSVVKNQLRGITWIGALLGAIIGILSNFIG
ncbi:MAG TPA: DUF445 family protein [Epulopiscium sp.]|nr:DUF445 family protein [Candidatus Epulonipiscium sp.]